MLITAATCAALAGWLLALGSRLHGARTVKPLPTSLLGSLGDRWRARAAREARRQAVREALAEVVADLRAGQAAGHAAERALASHDIAPGALAAIRWGGDVVVALRADSKRSGCELLVSAAACWSVAQSSGAGLAEALDRIVQQDRKAEEVRRQLAAHLAAPRATARMLAALPLLGVGLGFLIGGDPVAWLIGTSIGWGCLVAGSALTALGLLWAQRIAARTERLL